MAIAPGQIPASPSKIRPGNQPPIIPPGAPPIPGQAGKISPMPNGKVPTGSNSQSSASTNLPTGPSITPTGVDPRMEKCKSLYRTNLMVEVYKKILGRKSVKLGVRKPKPGPGVARTGQSQIAQNVSANTGQPQIPQNVSNQISKPMGPSSQTLNSQDDLNSKNIKANTSRYRDQSLNASIAPSKSDPYDAFANPFSPPKQTTRRRPKKLVYNKRINDRFEVPEDFKQHSHGGLRNFLSKSVRGFSGVLRNFKKNWKALEPKY